MPDPVADQVVERLSQPLRVTLDREPGLRPADDAVAARERRRLGRIACQATDVDPFGAKRYRGGLDEEALDAHQSGLCELQQPLPASAVRAGIGVRDRDERRNGAPDLVHHDVEAARVAAHPARSPIRSIAHAAVSASIGSSLRAHSSASGSASSVAVLPSAVSAFRRSHRESLRGT